MQALSNHTQMEGVLVWLTLWAHSNGMTTYRFSQRICNPKGNGYQNSLDGVIRHDRTDYLRGRGWMGRETNGPLAEGRITCHSQPGFTASDSVINSGINWQVRQDYQEHHVQSPTDDPLDFSQGHCNNLYGYPEWIPGVFQPPPGNSTGLGTVNPPVVTPQQWLTTMQSIR